MEKIKVKWTAFALMQLEVICNYIADNSKSETIAYNYITKLFKKTERLISQPESGQIEELLKEDEIRYIVEGNYKILYIFNKNKMEIIITDVFHTKQNPVKMSGKA